MKYDYVKRGPGSYDVIEKATGRQIAVNMAEDFAQRIAASLNSAAGVEVEVDSENQEAVDANIAIRQEEDPHRPRKPRK